jgi:release factor glutamine methyltransferase
MMISSSALKNAESILKKSQIPSWRLDAEILLAEVLRKDRSELIIRNNIKISNKKAFTFNRYIDRRKKFEPVAYILNNKEFFSLDFFVNKNSLIPRPETELMVEKAIEIYKKKAPNILDIGTGSGCIIISVLRHLPKSRGIGLDISKNAIKVAKFNSEKLLKVYNKRLKFMNVSIEKLSNNRIFDLILANPPYINSKDIRNLSTDIKRYEPKIALDGGKDGLDVIKKVIYKSLRILKHNGTLAIEIGNNQYFAVSKLLRKNGFKKTTLLKDYKNNIRCIFSTLK